MIDSDESEHIKLRSGRSLTDSRQLASGTNLSASEFPDPTPEEDPPVTLPYLANLVTKLTGLVTTMNTSLVTQQEAIADLQKQIPHNVASGVTSISKDLHQKLQIHTSNESKNHSDMNERITYLESATPDLVLIRLVGTLESTMDKLATALMKMQASADAQSKATLHIQEMHLAKSTLHLMILS